MLSSATLSAHCGNQWMPKFVLGSIALLKSTGDTPTKGVVKVHSMLTGNTLTSDDEAAIALGKYPSIYDTFLSLRKKDLVYQCNELLYSRAIVLEEQCDRYPFIPVTEDIKEMVMELDKVRDKYTEADRDRLKQLELTLRQYTNNFVALKGTAYFHNIGDTIRSLMNSIDSIEDAYSVLSISAILTTKDDTAEYMFQDDSLDTFVQNRKKTHPIFSGKNISNEVIICIGIDNFDRLPFFGEDDITCFTDEATNYLLYTLAAWPKNIGQGRGRHALNSPAAESSYD